MLLKNRIAKLEQRHREKRVAVFTVHNGKATGMAWYDDRLVWKNLTRGELDALQATLEGEGVEVMIVHCVSFLPDGTQLDGWNTERHSPQEIIDMWDANCS